MRGARAFAIVGGALLALALVACGSDGKVTIAGQDGTEIDISTATATATASAEASPSTAPTEGATPEDGAATPTPGDTTPTAMPDDDDDDDATPTPSATSSPQAGDRLGAPYGSADVRAAIESGAGSFAVDDEVEQLCPDTSVPGTAFRAEGDALWSLWVYPDAEAREADWVMEDGQLEPQTDDCELPTGFNYFNANVVIAVLKRGSGAEDVRDAFLSLGSGGSGDDED